MIAYNLISKLDQTQCLIVPVWEGVALVKQWAGLSRYLDGFLGQVIRPGDFEAHKGESCLIYTGNKRISRVLLIGLGKPSEITIIRWKEVIGAAVIYVQSKKLDQFALLPPVELVNKLGGKTFGLATVVAIETAAYAFDEHKSDKKARVKPLKNATIVGEFSGLDKRQAQKGIAEGAIIASAVNYVRRLGNTPPSIMTPSLLAEYALELAKGRSRLWTRVLSRPEIKKLGMGCLLGVSSGSAKEPKFIIVEYRGAGKEQKPTILIGKGITFDSGGLHLKPDQYMTEMKFDMLGAAVVLGVIKAAAALGLKKNLIGLIPACENMPDGDSYRPDDILTAMNGKTVEIINTDAEGRVILADALSYASLKYKPKEVIDLATLTGACMVALGLERSGLFSNDDKLAAKILACSEKAGEQLWRLPLGEEYSEQMKSEVADIKNLGDRYGGASTGAAFLQFFTLQPKSGTTIYPWAHIDLSSCYNKGKGKAWIRGGANGFGVQTLVEYLR